VPERIVVRDELPVTARGKVDRTAVLALLRESSRA
jgi:acyl-CoA synthetase (AMP-forming)/AMP-acid ligase II